MLPFVRLLPLLLALLPVTLQAQSTQADLEARLLHKPLYIRGLWRNSTLHFDPDGKLLGDDAHQSFTLSGLDIRKVKLHDGNLLLEGRRVGVEFSHDNPRRVSLDGSETVRIRIDPSPDFNPALQSIFADSLTDLAPSLPFYWQPYARQHLLAVPDPTPPTTPKKPADRTIPPKILQSVEPEFSNEARLLGYVGSTLVHVKLNEQGKVVEANILRPIGLGLDEQALSAAVRYRFAPATLDGQPVSFDVNFEVNFSR